MSALCLTLNLILIKSDYTENNGLKIDLAGVDPNLFEHSDEMPKNMQMDKGHKMNQPKQKNKSKANGGILKKIGAMALLPLAIAGSASGSSTRLNSSSGGVVGLPNSLYGAQTQMKSAGYGNFQDGSLREQIHRELGAFLAEEEEAEVQLTNKDQNSAIMAAKINVLKEQWQKNSKTKIEFDNVFAEYGATTDAQKLSLLNELFQRSTGAKCRCDNKIKLSEYGKVEKVGNSFFTINRTTFVEVQHFIKNFKVNSEYYEACMTLAEVDTKNDPNLINEWMKREIKVLKELSGKTKHIMRLFESEENGPVIKLVAENVLIDFYGFWHNSDKEERLGFVQALYEQMLKALEEFHKFGTHLNVNLAKFFFVEDADSTDNVLEFMGKIVKVKTIIDNFGSAILFGEKLPKNNLDDFGDSRKSSVGSLIYSCPERISGAYELTPKCDIFSLGIVLYEMLTPRVGNPYHFMCREYTGKNEYNKCVKLAFERFIVVGDSNKITSLGKIILASTQRNPNERPTAKGIRKYLRGECRFYLKALNEKLGINDGVPMVKCDTE
uniref:Protein kinase domain-containing protein n=1 Tax=Globodera rostochiensis TaxID=31243 RepID=A0A914GRS0_GLORO